MNYKFFAVIDQVVKATDSFVRKASQDITDIWFQRGTPEIDIKKFTDNFIHTLDELTEKHPDQVDKILKDIEDKK
jgi:hypothetical protein